MRIVKMYPHLNGHDFILAHRPQLWKDIEEVIAEVDAETCRNKISADKQTLGKVFYSPKEMNQAFKCELGKRGWSESRTSYWVSGDPKLIRRTIQLSPDEQRRKIFEAGETPIRSYKQTDFLKERIAIEIQFGDYTAVAYDLFVKHMTFYEEDIIDVGIEILPMKELQTQMPSGAYYYESGIYDIIRQGRAVPAVPLVIIGIAP